MVIGGAHMRTLRTAKRLQLAYRFLNDVPSLAQMLFCGEHISEANSHHCSATQFCLGEIRAARRVDSLDNVAVDSIQAIDGAGAPSRRCARARRRRRGTNKTKTDHAHAG